MGPSATMPRVYLAGPGVFREDAASYGKMLRKKCNRAGLDGCYPLDADITPDAPLATARATTARMSPSSMLHPPLSLTSPHSGDLTWIKAQLGRSATGSPKTCRYLLGR